MVGSRDIMILFLFAVFQYRKPPFFLQGRRWMLDHDKMGIIQIVMVVDTFDYETQLSRRFGRDTTASNILLASLVTRPTY